MYICICMYVYSLPPLLVKAHGGPTACTATSFNPGILYMYIVYVHVYRHPYIVRRSERLGAYLYVYVHVHVYVYVCIGIQFWTSRGFAVLDVDYRGSTGYGRQYRNVMGFRVSLVTGFRFSLGTEVLRATHTHTQHTHNTQHTTHNTHTQTHTQTHTRPCVGTGGYAT